MEFGFKESTGKEKGWVPNRINDEVDRMRMDEDRKKRIEMLFGDTYVTETMVSTSTSKPIFMPSLVHSWTGEVDRIELVKSVFAHCRKAEVVDVHHHGNISAISTMPLSDQEIEDAVHLYEVSEERMCIENWEDAFKGFIKLVNLYPTFALGYMKAGICVAAISARISFNDSQQPSIKSNANNKKDNLNEVSAADIALKLENDVLHEYFRCAIYLEPGNVHLVGLIDLFIQVFAMKKAKATPTNIEKEKWGTALYPKSFGDVIALHALMFPEKHFG